ncbi:hypothetical protein [Pedobacter sp. NJ-S-72]
MGKNPEILAQNWRFNFQLTKLKTNEQENFFLFDDDQEVLTAMESLLDFADWDLLTFSTGRDALLQKKKERNLT